MSSFDLNKVNTKIRKEERYQKYMWKSLIYKELLKPTQWKKVYDLIKLSELRVAKLKKKKIDYMGNIKLLSEKIKFSMEDMCSE